MRRRKILLLVGALLVVGLANEAPAQPGGWPDNAVKLILPEEVRAYLVEHTERSAELIKAASIKLE